MGGFDTKQLAKELSNSKDPSIKKIVENSHKLEKIFEKMERDLQEVKAGRRPR